MQDWLTEPVFAELVKLSASVILAIVTNPIKVKMNPLLLLYKKPLNAIPFMALANSLKFLSEKALAVIINGFIAFTTNLN